MIIGLIADIHEHIEYLRRSLNALKHADVIIFLGDVFETGTQVNLAVRLLSEARVVGVWGNHDLGLCHEPSENLQARFPAATIEYLAELSPQFELDDILFCHGLPTWNPTDPSEYYLNPQPWEPNALDEVFERFGHRHVFAGHYHRWFLASENCPVEWDGKTKIRLESNLRHFIIVNGVLNACCAEFNTMTNELKPHFVG